jgi:hypothetical protein
MKPEDKKNEIIRRLKDGQDIYIRTALHCTRVTKKTFDKFEAINRPLFKVCGDSLYMSSGNKYNCIDYCKITSMKHLDDVIPVCDMCHKLDAKKGDGHNCHQHLINQGYEVQ